MKQLIHLFLVIFFLPICITSCDEKNIVQFNNPEDAIRLYHELNNHLLGLNETNIKDLSRHINNYLELQNELSRLYENDTTLIQYPNLVDHIFLLADSLGKQVIRLATNSSRCMQDVVYLKLNTAKNRDIIIHSEEYNTANLFFEKMNSNKVIPDATTTIKSYLNLLNKQSRFKSIDDFLSFLENEDTCFRSLLTHLNFISPEDLQQITDLTANLFETITQNVKQRDDELSSKIYTYLVMRFNRRIIQNATVCGELIKNSNSLTNIQIQDYRFMILQPFLSIDQDAMAYITSTQAKQLLELANELPSLLISLDPTQVAGNSKELEEILAKYLINTYIKFLL